MFSCKKLKFNAQNIQPLSYHYSTIFLADILSGVEREDLSSYFLKEEIKLINLT